MKTTLEIPDPLILDTNVLSAFADGEESIGEILRRPVPANDAWIAALAIQHTLPILSRDTHFDALPGLRRVSW